MKIFRSLLIALAMLSLIACGDDDGSLNGEDLVDSGVEDDAAVKPPPGEGEDDEDDEDEEEEEEDKDLDEEEPGIPPGEEPEDGPAPLSILIEQERMPYGGATVRVLGFETLETVSDAEGRVELEVPSRGQYAIWVEGLGEDWSYVYPVEVTEGQTNPPAVTFPSSSLINAMGDMIESPPSKSKAIVLWMFQLDGAPLGGQSVSLPAGEPYLQVPGPDEEEPFQLIPGSVLQPGSDPLVLYLNVPAGPLEHSLTSDREGEQCLPHFSPPGGWEAYPGAFVIIPVRCSS